MPREIVESKYAGQYVLDHSECPPGAHKDAPPVSGVYGPEGPPVGPHCGELVPMEPTQVSVGWSKDESGHVQIATLNYTLGLGSDDPAAGWFMQLDRIGVNRLIRLLRKARDDAFGRDE